MTKNPISKLATTLHRVIAGCLIPLAIVAVVIFTVFTLMLAMKPFTLVMVTMDVTHGGVVLEEGPLKPNKLMVHADGRLQPIRLVIQEATIVARPFDHFIFWLTVVWGIVSITLVFKVLHRLYSFTETMADGRPFDHENGNRLNQIGKYILAGQLSYFVFRMANQIYARTQFTIENGTIDLVPDLPIEGLLLGSLVLLIAEAFRLGTKLQQESDETI